MRFGELLLMVVLAVVLSAPAGAGFLLVDWDYMWPNARGGTIEGDGAGVGEVCEWVNSARPPAVCVGIEDVWADTGFGDFDSRFTKGSASPCSIVDAGQGTSIQCFGHADADRFDTRICRRSLDGLTCNPPDGDCDTSTIPDGITRQQMVMYDSSINRYLPLELYQATNTNCSTASSSIIGIARTPRLSVGAFSSTDTFNSSIGDNGHYTWSGDQAQGEFVANLKWEMAYFPSDTENLIPDGRAESGCSAYTETGAGAVSATGPRDDANANTNRAFRGTGCQVTGRTLDTDSFRIGPMEDLQGAYILANDGEPSEVTQYYVARGMLGCQSGENTDPLRIRIRDVDTGDYHSFIATEGGEGTPDGLVNEYKVWYHDGLNYVYATNDGGIAEIPPCSNKPGDGVGSLDLALTHPVIITFEVEACHDIGGTTQPGCQRDNQEENFQIEITNDSVGTGAPISYMFADEWFAWVKRHRDLALHDVFGSTVNAYFIGASNNEETGGICSQATRNSNNCENMAWGIRAAMARAGKIVPGSRSQNLSALSNYQMSDEFNSKFNIVSTLWPARLKANLSGHQYVFVNLGANDIAGLQDWSAADVRKIWRSWQANVVPLGVLPIFLADPSPGGQTTRDCQGEAVGVTCGEAWDLLMRGLLDDGGVAGVVLPSDRGTGARTRWPGIGCFPHC